MQDASVRHSESQDQRSDPQHTLLSRDRFVLLLIWGMMLWGGLSTWTQYHGLGSSPTAALLTALITSVLAITHIVLMVGSILLPLILYLATRVRFLSAIRWRSASVLGLLLFLFASATLFRSIVALWRPNRLGPLSGFVMAATLAGLLAWFFYRRVTFPHRILLITTAWGASILSGVDAARIAFEGGSGMGFALLLALSILLTLVPLLVVWPAGQRWLKRRFQDFSGMPLPVYGIGLMLGLLGLIAHVVWADRPGVFVGFRLLTLVAIGCAMLLLDRLIADPAPHADQLAPQANENLSWRVAAVFGLLYLAIAIAMIPTWLGGNTPDSFAYLQMARHFSQGEFAGRGLWPPMMSLLIAALSKALTIDLELAQRILVVINGLAWMLMIHVLARRIGLGRLGQALAVFLAGLWALQFTFWPLGTDFLAITTLLAYLLVVSDPAIARRPVWLGIVIGLVGTISYLTRYFYMPFVLAHLMLMVGWWLWHDYPRRSIVQTVSAALVVFALTALPWILILTQRYESPTLTTSSAFNHAWLGPHSRFTPICWTGGLCDKPDDILFPWEDPHISYYADLDWSMFESLDFFRFQLDQTQVNIELWARRMVQVFGLALPLVGIVWFVAFLESWRAPPRRFWYGLLLISAALYLGGYFLTNAGELRYYYPLFTFYALLLALGLEWIVNRIARLNFPSQAVRSVTQGLVVVGLILAVSIKGGEPPQAYFACQRHDAEALAPDLEAPIAGDQSIITAISYYTQTRTFGVVDTHADIDVIDAELRERGVRTFIGSDGSALTRSLIDDYGYQPVARHTICTDSFTILSVP